ncbi:MAG: PAS domain-containing protein, partial [Methylobacterium sp.]|uniref:HWE histidine kinase domain-containing protein n=1 Tax=Methylobacterium sp. TaxID=409 RepID=UPI0025D6B667
NGGRLRLGTTAGFKSESPAGFVGIRTLDEIRAALVAGEAYQGEAINYRKDGSTYYVEWLITPIRGDDGHISHWVSAQRDITERHAAEDRQTLMVRELHHRVKNTLATVQAVLNATTRSSTSIPDFARILTGRITSLAKTHAMITEDLAQAVLFRQLIEAELRVYENGRDRLSLNGPPVVLPSELAVPIGMALHELTINALKHGALAHSDGRIEVTWSLETATSGQRLHWVWNEHDGPPVALPTRDGFGSRVLNRVLTAQVGAQVDIAYDPDGLRVTVDMPLK